MSGRCLRLLMVTPRYFPDSGGVQTHVYEVARRLACSGVDVTVLTTDPSQRLPSEEYSDGVRILRVRAFPTRRDYYFAPWIWHIIVEGSWTLVHCQGCHTLVPLLAMLAARHASIPYLVTFHSGGHSSPLRNKLRKIQWMILRPLLAHAQRLVAVSQFEAKLFHKQLRLPVEQFAIIPNGSNLPTGVTQSSKRNSNPVIASIGRLEKYKGHHRVIAAIPKVLKHYPNALFQIVGTGPFKEELRRLAAEVGVLNHVEFVAIGGNDREAMARLLMDTDLVTLLSNYESQGIAVIEALALQRPVLVADTSALSELAVRGLVRAIPIDSTGDIVAQAMLDQLQQPLLPVDIDLPSWDDCAAQLHRLYQSLIREQNCVS